MNKLIFLLTILFSQIAFSQNVFNAVVKDSSTNKPLIGVNAYIQSLHIGAASDKNGYIHIKDVPNGKYVIKISDVGYESKNIQVDFPEKLYNKKVIILLKPEEVELNQVTVSALRTENRISNTPVRVEVLGLDEVNEEIGIKPGNISKLLGETSGVLLQQTSAASGNVAFRIQGLPAKYTQLLVDGFPLYSGFSSGLSLLQIPPLNLKQVEVIKGSASTLYGGDAIAGIVNLVTKEPSMKPKISFMLNQTQKGESDFSGYFSGRSKKFGLTLLSDYNFQKAVDVNHDGFTDIPKFQQANVTPKLYYYISKNQTLSDELSFSYDHRKGGDISVVNGTMIDSLHRYLLENKSVRVTSAFKYKYKFNNSDILQFKNSIDSYYRKINSLSYQFSGNQFSTFSELSYLINMKSNKLVLGLNFNTDSFTQKEMLPALFNYSYNTLGLFAEDNWQLSHALIWQLGFRADHHNKYGEFLLPQSFFLYKFNENLKLRLGGGLGYKIPTVFTDQTEEKVFQYVNPLSSNIKPEKSSSLSADLNYQTIFSGNLSLDFDQAFYYTWVEHPVTFANDTTANEQHPGFYFYNSSSNLSAKGFDTNLHLTLDDLEFYFEYTYTDAKQVFSNYSTYLQLTPKSKINITLTYEEEDDWRTGFEAFYIGKEYLSNGTQSPDYWTIGVMVQKYFDNFSVIANVENLFDVRQSKFGKIYNPPISDPTFNQLYAPLDGRVANIAVKIDI